MSRKGFDTSSRTLWSKSIYSLWQSVETDTSRKETVRTVMKVWRSCPLGPREETGRHYESLLDWEWIKTLGLLQTCIRGLIVKDTFLTTYTILFSYLNNHLLWSLTHKRSYFKDIQVYILWLNSTNFTALKTLTVNFLLFFNSNKWPERRQ